MSWYLHSQNNLSLNSYSISICGLWLTSLNLKKEERNCNSIEAHTPMNEVKILFVASIILDQSVLNRAKN